MLSLVSIITALNLVVFFFWQRPDPVVSLFMETHFLVSWDALSDGRWWVLITSAFSHNMFWHLLLNMVVLSNFGGILEQILGRRFFLIFYLVAAAVSSLTHAVVSAWLLGVPDMPALGASGAISGLVLIFCLLFPRERILILGLIPVPALLGALAFVGLDFWGLFEQSRGGGLPIGHGAHLGGAFTGILAYFLFIRGRVKARPARSEWDNLS